MQVAYQNLSFDASEIPVKINFDNGEYLHDTVVFSGIPFEVILKSYLAKELDIGTNKSISAYINWDNKNQEENSSNNIWTVVVDIPV